MNTNDVTYEEEPPRSTRACLPSNYQSHGRELHVFKRLTVHRTYHWLPMMLRSVAAEHWTPSRGPRVGSGTGRVGMSVAMLAGIPSSTGMVLWQHWILAKH